MNWLAHLRLAPAAPLVRVGNLAGDFVRGVDTALLHDDVRAGIEQHRAIDRFVDAHTVVRRARGRFEPPFRRFAGVLVDVYFDHFLASGWDRFGDGRPLTQFVDDVHDLLARNEAHLPPRLRSVLPWMRRERWLFEYSTLAGIDAVLERMAGRVPRPTPLAAGGEILRRERAAFAADFDELWPELERFAATLSAAHRPGIPEP